MEIVDVTIKEGDFTINSATYTLYLWKIEKIWVLWIKQTTKKKKKISLCIKRLKIT